MKRGDVILHKNGQLMTIRWITDDYKIVSCDWFNISNKLHDGRFNLSEFILDQNQIPKIYTQ